MMFRCSDVRLFIFDLGFEALFTMGLCRVCMLANIRYKCFEKKKPDTSVDTGTNSTPVGVTVHESRNECMSLRYQRTVSDQRAPPSNRVAINHVTPVLPSARRPAMQNGLPLTLTVCQLP
jgi:hypothetical protein